MPRYEDYAGPTLAEALRQFAEHHSEPRTRHITSDERKLLHDAADWMEHRGCRRVIEP